MRVAIVHDWLVGMRGGERVVEQLVLMYPDCELFTLVHVPGSVSQVIESRPIHASVISRLPGVRRYYRHLLPFFPTLIERFDLSGFDLVISNSTCVAKGARPPKHVPHLCYCQSPMRYLYDQRMAYAQAGPLLRIGLAATAPYLRSWDASSSSRVHRFVANSEHVRGRIHAAYARDSWVVHPPVDVTRFTHTSSREDFFLCAGALVPYKRADVAIDAFNSLGRRLVVAGIGPELPRLRRMAGPNVHFTGWLPDPELARLLERCRALVFPGIEDYGILPLEAQAAGAPVIAYAAGGVLETVLDARVHNGSGTGLLYDDPTPDGLQRAVLDFEQRSFDPAVLRAHSQSFAVPVFRANFQAAVDRLLTERAAPVPA